jgi:hypothetical protein
MQSLSVRVILNSYEACQCVVKGSHLFAVWGGVDVRRQDGNNTWHWYCRSSKLDKRLVRKSCSVYIDVRGALP